MKGTKDETNDELIEPDEVLVIKRALDANLTFQIVHILSLFNEFDSDKSSLRVNTSINNTKVSSSQMFFQGDSQRLNEGLSSFNNST